MKKLTMAIGLVGIGITLAAGFAFAQQTMVKADIPFEFVAENTQLPAGEYTVSQAMNGTRLVIRSADWHKQIFLTSGPADSASTAEQAKLVFHRYGDQYFLAQVCLAGSARGVAVGDREREMARSIEVTQVRILAKK